MGFLIENVPFCLEKIIDIPGLDILNKEVLIVSVVVKPVRDTAHFHGAIYTFFLKELVKIAVVLGTGAASTLKKACTAGSDHWPPSQVPRSLFPL